MAFPLITLPLINYLLATELFSSANIKVSFTQEGLQKAAKSNKASRKSGVHNDKASI